MSPTIKVRGVKHRSAVVKERRDMSNLASTILTVIFGLGTFACTIYLLYLLFREKGGAHAVLGFFFPPYPFVWGWINARKLEILDVMVFWTFVSIAAIVFPMVIGFRTLTTASEGFSADTEGSAFSEDTVLRGPISRGSQVTGRIDDLFGVDEWTMNGAAGEQVTIWCAPATGSDTDPRIKIIDPSGNEIGSDDDGGGGHTASINGLMLPSTGAYRILVDVWSTGPYILAVQ
jgi:hypothetical protein